MVNRNEYNSSKINLCLSDGLNKIKYMNSIIYFSRNKNAGFSIQKVFSAIIDNPNNHNNKSFEVPCYRANLNSLFKNICFIYSKRDRNCVHHITGDIHYCILGLIGFKSILTIHDLVLLKTTTNKTKKFIYFLFWYYLLRQCYFLCWVIWWKVCISAKQALKTAAIFSPVMAVC